MLPLIAGDMWDDHTCKAAVARVAEMAAAANRTVKAARDKGVLIIHAPSSTTSFYKDTPARRQATEAPFAKPPVSIGGQNAVSDQGQEIYNLLQQRGIDNVIILGVRFLAESYSTATGTQHSDGDGRSTQR